MPKERPDVRKTAGEPDAAKGHVLRNEGPGTRHFAADGRTLQHAQDDEQDGGRNADGGIGRHQRHAERRKRHEQDGEGEDAFAAITIAIMRENDAAQRPHQITGGEDAEGLDHHQPIGHFRREEQMADDGGEKHENDEIVELQRAAEGRKAESSVVLPVQGPGSCRCGGGRHKPASFSNSHVANGHEASDARFQALSAPNRS